MRRERFPSLSARARALLWRCYVDGVSLLIFNPLPAYLVGSEQGIFLSLHLILKCALGSDPKSYNTFLRAFTICRRARASERATGFSRACLAVVYSYLCPCFASTVPARGEVALPRALTHKCFILLYMLRSRKFRF